MATITVQASDTSTAMEEIALKLGEDAMILSTTKKNGKVIMQASNDAPAAPKQAQPASTSAISDFDRLFADKLGQELAKPTIDLSAAGAEQRRTPASAGSTSSGRTSSGRASASPSAQPGAIQTHLVSALGLLAEKMEHIEDRLAAMTLTPYEGLNPELGDSTPMQLRRSGFSDTIITNLHASFAGLGYEAGVSSFLSHLGQQLAITQSDSLMQKRIYFIVGPSGSGRTTLAAKLAANLKDEHSGRVVALAHLASSSAETDNKLKSYARLLNLPFCHLTHDVPANQFDKMTDFDIMVVDVTLSVDQSNHYLGQLTEHLGTSEVQTIMSLQGGSSASLIRQSLTAYKQVDPLIALTKLDECETTPAEFSALAEQDASIALLSGTRSVVGALAFASGNIISQYLTENFSSALRLNSERETGV
jgi:flagellar biosynthesis GTPase FlhF